MKQYEGLTSQEVKERQVTYGLNEIIDSNKSSVFQILFRQVKTNFVVFLLVFTLLLSLFLGKMITAVVILIVISIVIITGFIQEYKAEQAISTLKRMIMPISRLIRSGKEVDVASSQIVPDDIVLLRTGEKIPADAIILDATNLRVNESILTGESSEVAKSEYSGTDDPTDEQIVFMGTFVVNGKAVVKVIHTGMNTKFGKIAGMISTAEKELPLQKKVNTIAKYMALVSAVTAVATGLIILGRADTVTNELIVEILIIVVALAVSSFPEGFPVVLTTTLAAGVNRMAKQNAIVNRMSIIETLGETSVICSDKTGTITKGEMTGKKIIIHNNEFDVEGVGYQVEGSIQKHNENISLAHQHIVKKLLETSIICNDASIQQDESAGLFRITGSSTEAALLVMAAKAGLYKEEFVNERIEEMPFDSKRKMMSVLYQGSNGSEVYAKGAPEYILAQCTKILTNDGVEHLSDKEREILKQKNIQLTSRAYRTLALAYKPHQDQGYTETELIFLGFVGLEDPPREEVLEAVQHCKTSGIQVKIITGDNQETAQAIAQQIGIQGSVLTGKELDQMSDDELSRVVGQVAVFARVKPEDKLRIVRALKSNGEIVTMTGDGVNDAPALKEAHIGVAMGINGTDVSRSVADITLKDDNFATIIAAIKEGRTIFNNIRKFVTYQLACNFANILVVFVAILVAPILGWKVPLITALQILFMNIVTDNLPAITLGFNPTSVNIMSEKPRKNARILTLDFINVILVNGSLMAFVTAVVAYYSYNILQFPAAMAQSTVLLSLILMHIANAFNFRSFRYRVLNRGLLVNRLLFFASLLSILFTIVILYTPMNVLFETVPLGPASWLIAFWAMLVMIFAFDVFKTINNRTRLFLEHIH